MTHSYGWSAFNSDFAGIFTRADLDPRDMFKTVIYDIEDDSYYKMIVNISFLVSWIVAFVSGAFYIKLRKK